MRCEAVFHDIYNRDPDGVAFCPYRISPLGAHIDHQHGKINGIGTHETLLRENEIYREVYESQKKGAEL